jgi:hypothetical protein
MMVWEVGIPGKTGVSRLITKSQDCGVSATTAGFVLQPLIWRRLIGKADSIRWSSHFQTVRDTSPNP